MAVSGNNWENWVLEKIGREIRSQNPNLWNWMAEMSSTIRERDPYIWGRLHDVYAVREHWCNYECHTEQQHFSQSFIHLFHPVHLSLTQYFPDWIEHKMRDHLCCSAVYASALFLFLPCCAYPLQCPALVNEIRSWSFESAQYSDLLLLLLTSFQQPVAALLQWWRCALLRLRCRDIKVVINNYWSLF